MDLTPEEVRVLGCLVEKAATTPDNYPLSTNALTNACNQKNNRDPVVDFTERTVIEALLLLRPAGLARTVTGSGRVEKHRHTIDEAWELSDRQLAILAVLMLRGPNSPGELKTRTDRYVAFDDLADIERVLHSLSDRSEPLVTNIGRLSGQSQDRWTHLLSSDPAPAPLDGATTSAVQPTPVVPPTPRPRSELEERVEQLERRLARLESELGLIDSADSPTEPEPPADSSV